MDLACGVYLRAGGSRKRLGPFSNATDSERHAPRENPVLSALPTPEADGEFAESVDHLIPFDIPGTTRLTALAG
jgi:hypothetical protein